MKHFTVTMRLHTTDIENGISVDIGGGSTEVTLFKDKQLKESHSFPFGVVSLKRQFLVIKNIMTKQPLKIWNSFYVSNLVS